MRRLPGILLVTGTTVIVIAALLISGLRLVLPELNHYRPQLLAKVASLSGVPCRLILYKAVGKPTARLEMRNIGATLPKGNLRIERPTLALDVWQSLLHWRW